MTRAEADIILQEAEKLNAGTWIGHSYTVANLAEKIAQDVAEELKVDSGDVSVAFEEVEKED